MIAFVRRHFIASAAGVVALFIVQGGGDAQTVGITAHNLRQYLAGAATPVTAPFTIQHAAVTCNATVPTVGKTAYWDDPDNAGKVCFWTDPGTGPLFAKVYGAIEYTLTNLAGTTESPESAPRTPFTNPPLAPTGLHRTP